MRLLLLEEQTSRNSSRNRDSIQYTLNPHEKLHKNLHETQIWKGDIYQLLMSMKFLNFLVVHFESFFVNILVNFSWRFSWGFKVYWIESQGCHPIDYNLSQKELATCSFVYTGPWGTWSHQEEAWGSNRRDGCLACRQPVPLHPMARSQLTGKPCKQLLEHVVSVNIICVWPLSPRQRTS